MKLVRLLGFNRSINEKERHKGMKWYKNFKKRLIENETRLVSTGPVVPRPYCDSVL